MSAIDTCPCDICRDNDSCWKLLPGGKYLAIKKFKIFHCKKARNYMVETGGFPLKYHQGKTTN